MCVFKPPKIDIPDPPEPPPLPSQAKTADFAKNARDRADRLFAKQNGRSSTVLTNPLGLAGDASSKKTLLGGY